MPPRLANLFRQLFCPQSVYERRVATSKYWAKEFANTVQYGPFKGMQLATSPVWSQGDLAPKLFGLYERQILDQLNTLSLTRSTLIDCGAADGYYAVGSLYSGMFDRCIAYEISQVSRSVIGNLAVQHNVDQRLTVCGEVSSRILLELDKNLLADSVLLVDIEGGEFDLFSDSVVQHLKNTACIIELHSWLVEAGEEKERLLESMLRRTHSVRRLGFGARDLAGFPELRRVNDDDRWLIASEGRGRVMEWMVCVPREAVALIQE